MKLINADEAIINFSFEWGDIAPTCEEVIEFLKRQPTIDAVPVVRCCQCNNGIVLQHSDFVVCHRGRMKQMDFCSYGERKGGDGNG